MEDTIGRTQPCHCGKKPKLEDFRFGAGHVAIRAFCECGLGGLTIANEVLTAELLEDVIDAWNEAVSAPGALH